MWGKRCACVCGRIRGSVQEMLKLDAGRQLTVVSGYTARDGFQLLADRKGVLDNDELFFELKGELATLFEVEQLTLYAVDREKRELYSKYLLDPLDGVQEIRVPINEASVSGYCARYGKIVNIADAYDTAELATINPRLSFDPSWDKRSGFRSRQML